MLERIFQDIRRLYRRLLAEREAEQSVCTTPPSLNATLEDVERLDPEDPLLVAIALRHHDPTVAGAAVERIKPRRSLRMIANTQEASREARVIAIGKLGRCRAGLEDSFLVDLAIRDDDPVIAQFAAHHVRMPWWINELRRSKYETVRLVVASSSKDADLLKSMEREDPSPIIRARATLRLRELIDGYSES
ncbi:hypothetical protein EDM68_05435 [Candidatus Uhrbacteria bacterium]|nr:MAG: hypothetical protein EDM68_05435 [Candidatus Uhrbacteria bacterium]